MGEVVQLRAPVIPRIHQAVKVLLGAGCTGNMVCLLNRADKELLDAEVEPLLTKSVTGAPFDDSVSMFLCGARIDIHYNRYVPDGKMVAQKAPESTADILKMLYDKERIDSFMSKPHQFEDAQIFTWKGNTP